jgi:tetratricopeptide (TPR) repeat protein
VHLLLVLATGAMVSWTLHGYAQSEGTTRPGAAQVDTVVTLQDRIAEERGLIKTGIDQHSRDEVMGYLWARLASDYRRAWKSEDAEAAYMKALSFLDHSASATKNYATALDNLSMLYLTYGRMEEAERYNKKAALIREEKGYRLDFARSEQHKAEIDLAWHRIKEAETEATRALGVMDELNDPEQLEVIAVLNTLAYTRCLRKRCEQGMEAAQRSLELARGSFGDESTPAAHALMAVGFALWKLGRPDDADRAMREGVRMIKAQSGLQSRTLLLALSQYRDYLKNVHRECDAEDVARELAATKSHGPFCSSCVTVNSLRGLAK